MYSIDEVLTFIAQEDVKFIRLTFFDIFGRQKNVSVMPNMLERAFREGMSVDAGGIDGLGGEVRLVPDPSTLAVLPWRPSHGRVVRMYCAIFRPDGAPHEADSRALLAAAAARARKAGLAVEADSRASFYLLKTDEHGGVTDEPFDRAGYMDVYPDDLGENVRRAICLAMEEMGLVPRASRHEAGPGQNGIDYAPDSPAAAADDAMTFRWVVKSVSMQNGLYADFSPAPIAGAPGNELRLSLTVPGGAADGFYAGILRYLPDMATFLCPSAAAFGRGLTAGVRDGRLTLRLPDPSADPYLVTALLLLAGLEGTDGKAPPAVPASAAEAKARAEKSAFLARQLPGCYLAAYTDAARLR